VCKRDDSAGAGKREELLANDRRLVFWSRVGAAQKLLYLAGQGRSASDCGNDVDCVAAVTGTTAVVRLLWPTFFTIVSWW
jgi:hypothetical protein